MVVGRTVATALAMLLAWGGCTNNPYPDEDSGGKILYAPFNSPPKTLDPATAYSVVDHKITGPVYETLLEYHFLQRPYTLIPSIAREVPQPEPLAGGRVGYVFRLRDDLIYQADPCFAAFGDPGRSTRQITAADLAFELMRIGDPDVNSPVITTFAKIAGLTDFSQRLAQRRQEDPTFAARRIDHQYAEVGPVAGLEVLSTTDLRLVLVEPYPQILYWFAMEFTTPVPWEAIAYYDGEEGRDHFNEHPVGSGPYRVDLYDKRNHIVLVRNPNWYGIRHPEWKAPAAIYPSEGQAEDAALGRLDPQYVGKPLPFIDRVEFRLEKETIPSFNKFLQGYYDSSGIIQESFDNIVQEGDLSPEMRALGMRLEKSISPSVSYLGFNMLDPVVGTAAGERGRKLRQAMSLAVDVEEYLRVFQNGRGVPAQSPIPPGLFGYDDGYQNPYRQLDLDRARSLLAEAGYPRGVDPKTGKPLRLTYDTPDTQARSRLRFQFFVDAWTRIGLDVEIAATNYNQFREKVRKGSYQIFQWGWIADYPDPENFLFLLWSQMAEAKSRGPNTANFENARYDRLFLEMRNLENGPHRLELIRKLIAIVERERPWIELFHRESYALYQPWLRNVKPLGMSFSTLKYRDLDPDQRERLRREWNEPVRWPAYGLAAIGIGIVIPGILTFFRERQ